MKTYFILPAGIFMVKSQGLFVFSETCTPLSFCCFKLCFLFVFFVLETMAWENVVMDQYDDSLPRARAGHCSVAVSFVQMLFFAQNTLKITLSVETQN